MNFFFLLSELKSLTFMSKCLFIQQLSPFTGFINFHIKLLLSFYTNLIIVLAIHAAKMYLSLQEALADTIFSNRPALYIL